MITILVSKFNDSISQGLLDGCLESFKKVDFPLEDIIIEYVPGAFELPAAALKLCNIPENDIVIALGCVIKGETDHYHYICEAVSKGIMDVSLKSLTPILFGVLTCQNLQLAVDRSSPNLDKNKGYEVGNSAIKLLQKKRSI